LGIYGVTLSPFKLMLNPFQEIIWNERKVKCYFLCVDLEYNTLVYASYKYRKAKLYSSIVLHRDNLYCKLSI